jgi:hypothetical protein
LGGDVAAGAGRLDHAPAIEQRDDVLTVRGLPGDAPDDLDTVIEVELDGGPDALPGSYVFWAGEARY